MLPIPQARLHSKSKPHVRPRNLQVTEYWFSCPVDYSDPAGQKTIRIFARTVTKYEKPLVGDDSTVVKPIRPLLAYLIGGPGAGNQAPQDSPLSSLVLDRGYELVLVDYRGTGLSSPVSAATLQSVGKPEDQARYLRHFRADSIAKDCEGIRQYLTANYPPEKKKWSILGQSFGGMVALNYLSFHPEGLRECFITAGLHALNKPIDDIYRAMHGRVIERNNAYYRKYPEDVLAIQEVVHGIKEIGAKDGILLPRGGRLTARSFLSLGFQLGARGGIDRLHDLVTRLKGDLDTTQLLTYPTLAVIEQTMPWDTVPIYALQESFAISGPGQASGWAAYRTSQAFEEYKWLEDGWSGPRMSQDSPIYFTGGMIFPSLFDEAGPEMAQYKETADLLARFDKWSYMYDEAQLARNQVPVYAAIFDDMYSDRGFARETASKIGGLKLYETNVMDHSAIMTEPARVMKELFSLRDDVIE